MAQGPYDSMSGIDDNYQSLDNRSRIQRSGYIEIE